MATWIPIAKKRLELTDTELGETRPPIVKEHFAGDTPTSNNPVVTGFTVFLAVAIGLLMLGFFYWAYKRDKAIMIGALACVGVLYTLEQVIMIVTLKPYLTPTIYTIYLASTLFVMSVFVIVAAFAFYKYYKHTTDGVSSYDPPVSSYQPTPRVNFDNSDSGNMM